MSEDNVNIQFAKISRNFFYKLLIDIFGDMCYTNLRKEKNSALTE